MNLRTFQLAAGCLIVVAVGYWLIPSKRMTPDESLLPRNIGNPAVEELRHDSAPSGIKNTESQAVSLLSDSDPKVARAEAIALSIHLALAEKNHDLRMLKLNSALEAWIDVDPEAAVRWISSNPGDSLSYQVQLDLLHKGLASWAEVNAPSAAKFAKNISVEDTDVHPIEAVMGKWASRDLQAARAFVDGLTDPGVQVTAVRGMLWEISGAQPKLAGEIAGRYGSPTQRDTNLAVVAGEWSKTDPASAWAWSNAQPNVNTRGTSGASIAFAFSQRDPESAAAWASRLPASDIREMAWGGVVLSLAAQDSAKAADWLATLPTGADRDNAAKAFIGSVASNDGIRAADAALLIGDEKVRQEQVATALKAWQNSSPDAVANWRAVHPGY